MWFKFVSQSKFFQFLVRIFAYLSSFVLASPSSFDLRVCFQLYNRENAWCFPFSCQLRRLTWSSISHSRHRIVLCCCWKAFHSYQLQKMTSESLVARSACIDIIYRWLHAVRRSYLLGVIWSMWYLSTQK